MSKTVSTSRFRTAKWLQKSGFAPQVFLFRNLESGQVVYSQLPHFSQRQIDVNFYRPNWENKKPSTRPDIWRCMAVVDLKTYEDSVKLYQNLCRLRYLREVPKRSEAEAMRKRNEWGHIWYSAQFRPTYTQEAVADLIEALSKVADFATTVHWEDPWRMGDYEKYWKPVLPGLKHEFMTRKGNFAREESAILKQLGERAKLAFQAQENTQENTQENAQEKPQETLSDTK
ncbi:HBR310Wp [Eremothecium sinecaudum]|uniref:Large ribosomal subunit protein mL67 n=1 Tax=Eremothecium sinecaudum TaxID=45286 RepID=A0A109UX80_9SACH|nr:HBR310Wp [Eremothecium sinecaudum]AMD19211.1 HBR310Wp [Eremothecium sinecaudum]